jgi:hypothetical protein
MEIFFNFFPTTHKKETGKKGKLIYLLVISALLINSVAFAGRLEPLGPGQFADYEAVLRETGNPDLAIESGTIEYPDKPKGPKVIRLNCLNEWGDKASVTIREFPPPEKGGSPVRILRIKRMP